MALTVPRTGIAGTAGRISSNINTLFEPAGQSQTPGKDKPRWQTAGLNPDCHSPRSGSRTGSASKETKSAKPFNLFLKRRAAKTAQVFAHMLGIIWLVTIAFVYLTMIVNIR